MYERSLDSLCGKPIHEVEKMMGEMEHRAALTKEHQRMTRKVFDEIWPTAVEEGTEAWGCALREIDKIIDFISNNSRSFPNHKEHIDQWTALKEVAGCCNCMCVNGVCQFTICPNK